MKAISCLMAGLLLASVSSPAYSQSLADLAKKEKERRQAVKTDVKVITNEQTGKYAGAPVTTTTRTAEANATDKTAAGTEGAAAAKEKPAVDEPVDFQGRPESFWRQTFADARQKVQELENQANVLILKRNDLQNRFYREDSGYKQQEIQREIQKTIYEQDLNKEELAKAKASLADLEVEARKSGALPGWIR
ncbi:MAG: hypothetical protein H6Q05_1451 [Acidobacteria bacterium]|nr:hypothetical protein [Acidobacteriota bacterium]